MRMFSPPKIRKKIVSKYLNVIHFFLPILLLLASAPSIPLNAHELQCCTKCMTAQLQSVLRGREEFFTSCALQGATTISTEGIVSYFSGVAFPPANGIITSPATTLTKEKVASSIKTFIKHQVPFFFWGNGEKFDEFGLEYIGTFSGICCNVHQAIPPTTPSIAIEIQEAKSMEQMEQFNAFFIASIGIEDPIVIKQLGQLNQTASQRGRQHHILAYHNDILIGCATLATGDTAAGIWNLFTHPDYQKNGVGTAMVSYLMNEAKQQGYNHVMAVLEPTAMAEGLFTKLGFEKVCQFPVHIYQPKD